MNKVYVGVATPTTGQIRMCYAYSLARMVAYFSNHRLLPDLEEQKMDFLMLEGSGISSNREKLVQRALDIPELTHLLFIDDDMGFYWDTLHVMMARRQPIVACTYRRRMPPGIFTAAAMDMKTMVGVGEEDTGLREAWNCGFGFCLIERKVLEATTSPRFLLEWGESDNEYSTEDYSFFKQARGAGFQIYIDMEASKRIWHEGNLIYSWRGNYENILPTTP